MSDMVKLTDTLGHVSNIQYLSLAAIPISGQNSEKMLKDICSLMRKSLVHLDMSGCNLTDILLSILTKGMKMSRTLVAVHLSGNNMTEDMRGIMYEELTKTTNKSNIVDNSEFDNIFASQIATQKDAKTNKNIALSFRRQKRMRRFSISNKAENIKETIDDRHIEIKNSHLWKISNK